MDHKANENLLNLASADGQAGVSLPWPEEGQYKLNRDFITFRTAWREFPLSSGYLAALSGTGPSENSRAVGQEPRGVTTAKSPEGQLPPAVGFRTSRLSQLQGKCPPVKGSLGRGNWRKTRGAPASVFPPQDVVHFLEPGAPVWKHLPGSPTAPHGFPSMKQSPSWENRWDCLCLFSTQSL